MSAIFVISCVNLAVIIISKVSADISRGENTTTYPYIPCGDTYCYDPKEECKGVDSDNPYCACQENWRKTDGKCKHVCYIADIAICPPHSTCNILPHNFYDDYECTCDDGYKMFMGEECIKIERFTTTTNKSTTDTPIVTLNPTTAAPGDMDMKIAIYGGSGGLTIVAIIGIYFLYKYCTQK